MRKTQSTRKVSLSGRAIRWAARTSRARADEFRLAHGGTSGLRPGIGGWGYLTRTPCVAVTLRSLRPDDKRQPGRRFDTRARRTQTRFVEFVSGPGSGDGEQDGVALTAATAQG